MYGRRLQLLIDEPRYRRVAAEARRRRASVSSVIRDAIDRSLGPDAERRRAALKAVLAAEPVPMPDPETLRREIADAHDRRP
jgi:hypothetical protein